MGTVAIIKLSIDLFLASSLLFFALRYIRGNTDSRKTIELQRALRESVDEADTAGSALSDEMYKRQRELERLLQDLDGAESRVSKTIAAASSFQVPVQPQINPRQNQEPRQYQNSIEVRDSQAIELRSAQEWYEEETVLEPPSFSRKTVDSSTKQVTQSKSRLQSSVEVDIEPGNFTNSTYPNHKTSTGFEELEEVYRLAEDLIRAGQGLELVADRTKLPIEKVRILSQLVLREKESSPAMQGDRSDARLGALGHSRSQEVV